jgi:hypothetical protein
MSEPVGLQYGIEPIRTTAVPRPAVTSRTLVSDESYKDGSEFGGVGGLIQPAPHVPTASERLGMIYAIDPTDPGTEAGSVPAPELDGNFDPR